MCSERGTFQTEEFIIKMCEIIIDYYLKKSEAEIEMITVDNKDTISPEQLSLF